MHVQVFTFNPFTENTYILYDESGDCAIVDPGCYTSAEEKILVDFIKDTKLKPVSLLNTHCHIDHILGNQFIANKYNLKLAANRLEVSNIKSALEYGPNYGLYLDNPPMPEIWLEGGKKTTFGKTTLEILFTPGHSAGSVCFYHPETKQVISGDVLFKGSIGRTDLPGGSMEVLMRSIYQELLPLGNEVVIYSGHGPATTIGNEKKYNSFLQ